MVFYINLRNFTDPLEISVRSWTNTVRLRNMVTAGGLFKSCPFKPNPFLENNTLDSFHITSQEYDGVQYIPPETANTTLYFFELITNDFQDRYTPTRQINVTFREKFAHPRKFTCSCILLCDYTISHGILNLIFDGFIKRF
jgi:hypothetical protein